MVDEQEGCEWMNVSSGTGSPGQTRTKGRKTAVCVCVCRKGSYDAAKNLGFGDGWIQKNLGFGFGFGYRNKQHYAITFNLMTNFNNDFITFKLKNVQLYQYTDPCLTPIL